MPPDIPAGGAGRGDGDAGFDGDLVGVSFTGDLDGFARGRTSGQEVPTPAVAGVQEINAAWAYGTISP